MNVELPSSLNSGLDTRPILQIVLIYGWCLKLRCRMYFSSKLYSAQILHFSDDTLSLYFNEKLFHFLGNNMTSGGAWLIQLWWPNTNSITKVI